LILGTLIFIILTTYPIEFWRKTPFLFGSLQGFFLHESLNLSPNQVNQWKALPVASLAGKSGI
jgi:hypothetical protein